MKSVCALIINKSKNLLKKIKRVTLKNFRIVKKFLKKKFKQLKDYFLTNPKKAVFFLLIFFTVFLFLGSTVGRYVFYQIRDFYFTSKNFYFNSDKLDERMARYQVDNWSGADSYIITFNMNSYKNNLEYATSDIPYTVDYSCSSNVTCTATKTSGTITSDRHTDSFTITITPAAQFSDGDSAWLEVEATSSSPYVKKISGRFVIKVGKVGLSYEIVDKPGSPYMDLNITNTLDFYTVKEAFGDYVVGRRLDIETYSSLTDAQKAKCTSAKTTIEFDTDDVLLDMTNENYLRAINSHTSNIRGFNYIDGFAFKVDALSSTVVRLYKNDTTQDYTYPFVNSESIIDVEFE